MRTETTIESVHIAPSLSRVSTSTSDLILGPSIVDEEIDGLEILEAASRLGVSEGDIWRRIRNGQMVARTTQGKVFVYANLAAAKNFDNLMSQIDNSLPPHPESNPQYMEPSEGLVLHSESMMSRSNEISTLLEHLEHSKLENREIVKFTTESMARLNEMTDELLKMKDDVIASRENQVELLKDQLQSQFTELRRLTKENENLETVARFNSKD